ncbi:mitochondrial carrier homolog 2 [Galendromus occidentalis]|uniref:Mitochondrial carrier homolog 2 n=1 Tax=Galendromus occidentalis TaxID=34638 RepID=A0AAJ6QNU6_9ACAR|nr:mitochondrial carrier homolog 2 [Galendromus occidentalis]
MTEDLHMHPRRRVVENDDKAEPWLSVVGKSAMTVVMHPFDYAKTLMQIGFEPLPPVPAHTIFRRPVLKLPGVFAYMGHLRGVDGFFGLYRGLGASLTGRIVYDSCFVFVTMRLPPVASFDEDQQLLVGDCPLTSDGQKIVNFIKRTAQESVAYAAAITVAQPFRVITIRMMAEFVGRETKYNSVLGSFVEIYREEGLSGLWSGLVPRIYGEILRIWLAATTAFFINTYIVEDPTVRSYIATMSSFLASSLTYPFALVSTVVSVSGAPIVAGRPPHVAIYSNWTQCYTHLKKNDQLKRGSSLFWRYYNPVEVSRGIAYKKPVDFVNLD